MIPEWVRKIPTPTYGNCGGGNLDCSATGKPIDKMDACFMEHDMNCESANQATEDPEERAKLKAEGDRILGAQLRNEKDLLPYAKPIWGPIFNRGARLVFRP